MDVLSFSETILTYLKVLISMASGLFRLDQFDQVQIVLPGVM